MTQTYTHEPHPRIEERKAKGPVKTRDQRRLDHPNPIVRLNARFALWITLVVGTMWCAYIFALIAFVSLPSTIKQHSATVIVLWLSSEFIQLVLLPIIIVGQNIQAQAADKRSEDTYKDAAAVLHEALEIQKHLKAQDVEIDKILQALQAARPG